MGQGPSTDSITHAIQKVLQTQGVKAKKTQIASFVHSLDIICPWLRDEENINEVWDKVGKQVSKALAENPDRYPENVFSFWAMISAALGHGPPKEIQQALSELEDSLSEERERRSTCSQASEGKGSNMEGDNMAAAATTSLSGAPLPASSCCLYPALPASALPLPAPPTAPPLYEENLPSTPFCKEKFSPGYGQVGDFSTTLVEGRFASLSLSQKRSPLEQCLQNALDNKESTEEVQRLFPVFELQGPQGLYREYRPLEFKIIKELKLAVSQYGPSAPFTMAIFESLAGNWLTPGDWKAVSKAVLSGGDYLLWLTNYTEQCKVTARRNQQAGAALASYEMLAGEGLFATNQAQMQYQPPVFD